jgi:hypothetical protein
MRSVKNNLEAPSGDGVFLLFSGSAGGEKREGIKKVK